ncbi:UDP-4-amino-4,6-dideoxy-N-acetyl-beta-L-altrosamine transaminase [ANME-1 cluster archaeon AG-394-G06]|nr:UDP-4-amino-4,6-dideoxy-N-acetyl-beta-L-altrosamine transaminase [ANME-1 cluster archaeon AG-394-G06]
MKFIPYGHQWIDEKDIAEVVKVLKSDWITTGPKIAEFEDALSSYIGCKYAVAVNSGTSALDIAVQTLNLPAGSEVITTPFTFVATSNAILYNNLKPIFVDIEDDTRNINPEGIRKRITDKTKAISYVDYAGHPCDIEEIIEIAEEHDLYLIEDASHAIGAEYKSKKIGNFADVTVFSFHPVKHLTTGEGGAVVTNNEEFYEKLKMLRNHGIDKSALERFGPKAGWAYDLKFLGRNYRITDFQAALGISQLKKLDEFLRRRKEIVAMYNEVFGAIPEIETPIVKSYVKSAWHIYTILLNGMDRDDFFSKMRERNLGVNVHYIPIYRFSYYHEHFYNNPEDFPVTEEVFSRIVTLPLFSKMTDDEVLNVIEIVKEYKNKRR